MYALLWVYNTESVHSITELVFKFMNNFPEYLKSYLVLS